MDMFKPSMSEEEHYIFTKLQLSVFTLDHGDVIGVRVSGTIAGSIEKKLVDKLNGLNISQQQGKQW